MLTELFKNLTDTVVGVSHRRYCHLVILGSPVLVLEENGDIILFVI